MKTFGRGAPLFAQVLGLVVLSMVLVHVVLATLIATVPPPPPEVYRLSDVVRALRTPGVVEVENARPLVSTVQKRSPEEPATRRGRWRDDFRQQLARSLNVETTDIAIETKGGPRRMMMQSLTGEFRSVLPPAPPSGIRRDPRAGQGAEALPPPAARVDDLQVNGVGVIIKRQSGGGRPPEMRVWNERVVFAPFKVGVRQPDGRWRVVQPRPSLRLGSWQLHILLTIALSTLIVAPVAWLFARRLSAPIALFAEAAERLGRDPKAPPLEVAGSREVAAATEAFNRMQERLRRYVEDRTAMVGAIAHDLRTPLTRLRFRIEAAPDELQGKLAAEIDQMDAMISATLAFVRDTTRAGPREKLELSSLVESIMDEAAETGSDATALPSGRLVVEGDPIALRRLVGNLVENALKYGQRARGRVFAEDGCAIVEIEDDGPGVATAEIERLFEPFYRGEPSRSRETGGAGLGLAVVRSIARGHGGDVTLHNRAGGGLTARVSLPL
ncbi:MAG: ATP-binding protein [Caulobacter sp.]|nr:ATP-binding protein [Caulobacter sp.]